MSFKKKQDTPPSAGELPSDPQPTDLQSTDPQSIDELLIELDSGSLTPGQMETLKAMLSDSEEARTDFVQWQLLSAAMQLESAVGDASVNDVGSAPMPAKDDVATAVTVSQKMRWHWLLSLAAGIGICLMAGRWVYLEWFDAAVNISDASSSQEKTEAELMVKARSSESSVEATSSGIAMVTKLVDAKWAAETMSASVGTALAPGRMKLDSGYAQIEFFCGATVILEGPAEIELLSSTAARFHQGRLRAQVPPAARGFQIDVDEMKVVDLGTEFGLSVSGDGADVQVFDGEVEVHRPDTAKQLVTAGQAITHNKADGVQAVRRGEVTPDQFVDLAKLDTQARDQTAERYAKWVSYSQELRQDPRVVAYYALDETHRWNRKLLNKANALAEGSAIGAAGVDIRGSELDGAIVGASRVVGRWPMKDALEFKQPGDRVRVNIPGDFRSLTFAAWVKIDSLDRWYNSLFLTDNYQKGEPHWQILDTGQLFFSVRPTESVAGPEHKKVLSPPFWNPSLSGKWLHLATTYDVDKKQTTHFLNGQPIHQETIPDLQLVSTTRIGMASIGNWSMPTKDDDQFAVRNLNGSLDELAIFREALTPAEIARMYEIGKP